MPWYTEYLKPEAAGMAGALLGFLHAPGSTWRERAFNLTAGVGASIYLAPWISESLIGVTSTKGHLAVAFFTGLVGMNLLSKIIEQARNLPPLNLGVFSSWFQKNNTTINDKPEDHRK